MKKAAQLIVTLFVITSASAVMAEPENDGTGKWYAGIAAGQSSYEGWGSKAEITALMDEFGTTLGIDSFNGSRSADADKNGSGYKLFGGYLFDDRLAVELSYLNMGEVEASSLASGTFYDQANNVRNGDLFASSKAKVDAITLDLKMNYPLTPVVGLIVKGGIYTADIKLNIDAGSSFSAETYSYAKTESSTGLHFAVGLRFTVTNEIGISAEWEQLDQVEANNGKADVNLLSIGLIYAF